MSDLSNRTLTIVAVSQAQDELLCKAVINAVLNGASEDEWRQVMRDTRALMAAKFFEMVDHFESYVAEDADAQQMRSLVAHFDEGGRTDG